MQRRNNLLLIFIAVIALVTAVMACNMSYIPVNEQGTPNGEEPGVESQTGPLSTSVAQQQLAGTATAVPAQSGPVNLQYAAFTPNWSGLSSACPSTDDVLRAHNLTGKVEVVASKHVSWEPCMVVVELLASEQGKTQIPLILGYQYTAALANADVTLFWGGDSNVSNVTLQWGVTIRWVPSYQNATDGDWLADACEVVVREYRFGRYHRNLNSGNPDVPYFNRVGPYVTFHGNLGCNGWIEPAIDQYVPTSYLQAAAIAGGRAVASEWIHSGDNYNWRWKHTNKVNGASVAPAGAKYYWQTAYVDGPGYVELWIARGGIGPNGTQVQNAGPYKFFASNLKILLDNQHNVDEFTYHADPNK